MNNSKTINFYLIDGTPTGRIKCSMQNWTGVAYKVPKTLIGECYKSGGEITDHLKQSGIYFLIGEDDKGNPSIYVGQAITRKNGDGILLRLTEHKKSNSEKYRDYWNYAICFTTANDSLGPTDISYLENKFTNLALQAKRYEVQNGNEPNKGNVTEEKESELCEFLQKARILLGVLGCQAFEPLLSDSQDLDVSKKANVRFAFKGTFHAFLELTEEGFVLLKGSQINDKILKSAPLSTIKEREKHQKDILGNETTCDILFHSSSAAACFVSGRSSNGNSDWKTEDFKSPKDF